MFYSWINITCHPEALKFFKIDQFQVPTVTYYYPQKELQANLIGMFNFDTISDHETKFMKGKLATWTPEKKHTEFTLEDVDCSKPLDISSAEDSSLDDEIMKEILEEEAAKAKEQEQENTKRKNVMGAKKKKKKGKKGAKKDEL